MHLLRCTGTMTYHLYQILYPKIQQVVKYEYRIEVEQRQSGARRIARIILNVYIKSAPLMLV